ncbi:OmpH family outer membrane protein [Rheinheimera sp.]|uniref:OmpH family outer membrane protein n=1 Tax=Rheinheimera sp. TaxID=1869214 RepID=UPI00307E64C3
MFKQNVAKTAVVLLAGLMMAGTAAAKEMKIGVVDVQSILSGLPQTTTIQNTLKAEFEGRIADVQKLEKDIAFNQEKLKRDGATMNDQQKKTLQAEMEKQMKNYEQLARPLDEDYRRRQGEERNKLMGLVKNAIDGIAAKDGYDLILSSQAAVHVKPEFDISKAVIDQVSKAK